jgi:hypothetical protein
MTAAKSAPKKLPKERTHFKELLLANHFGTNPASKQKAVAKATGNTTYEELTCVGYQPAAQRLDATVIIKQDAGYSGGICTEGSQEYVKFFTSTDGGASWDEQGTVAFTVYDVAGPKPLEYAAKLSVDLTEKCCTTENLVLVRAILSWEVPPGGPNDPVVWGNSLDATVQVAPLSAGTLLQLLECLKIKLPEGLADIADIEQAVTFGSGKALSPAELSAEYKGKKVPQHRFLLGHLQELLAYPGTLTEKLGTPGFELFPGVEKVDISKLIAILLDPQGDETFEQLGCLGLNPKTGELIATVDVKLSSGYSGGLCSAGSPELVAFWVDWEDGSGWHYVGTAAVGVHDIGSIPKNGLSYSVFLPFPDLYTHRKPCDDGPRLARIRAVLSWQTPPSTTDPYAVPVWGGHEETTILVPPGQPVSGGGGPFIDTIGDMDISDINNLTGLATGQSATVGFTATQSPFGANVVFTGHIVSRELTFGGPGILYRLWISTDGGAHYTYMNWPFQVVTHHLADPPLHITQLPQNLGGTLGDGWYIYREDSANLVTVDENKLGEWQSAVGGNGQALIYIEAIEAGTALGATTPKLIQLDNTAPVSTVAITSGAGSCGDFKVGDTISGTYATSDNEALGGVSFSLEPPPAGPPAVFSLSHSPLVVTPTSESGTWTLDTKLPGTAGLDPCGYVLRFDGTDRTIVNSAWVGWDGPAFTGFCLKK